MSTPDKTIGLNMSPSKSPLLIVSQGKKNTPQSLEPSIWLKLGQSNLDGAKWELFFNAEAKTQDSEGNNVPGPLWNHLVQPQAEMAKLEVPA